MHRIWMAFSLLTAPLKTKKAPFAITMAEKCGVGDPLGSLPKHWGRETIPFLSGSTPSADTPDFASAATESRLGSSILERAAASCGAADVEEGGKRVRGEWQG